MKTETIEALTREFDVDQIKTRLGPGGKELSYLEAHAVVGRLNAALASDWSFEIVEHHIHDDEVIVIGKITVASTPPVTKTDIGSQRIRRDDETGKPTSLGDDVKAAASDALKRCARLLGVGLFLYDRDSPQAEQRGPTQHRNGNGNGSTSGGGNGNGSRSNGRGSRVTNAQLGKLHELVDEVGGGDWSTFRDDTRERYGVMPEFLNKKQASEIIGEMLDRARAQRGNGARGAA